MMVTRTRERMWQNGHRTHWVCWRRMRGSVDSRGSGIGELHVVLGREEVGMALAAAGARSPRGTCPRVKASYHASVAPSDASSSSAASLSSLSSLPDALPFAAAPPSAPPSAPRSAAASSAGSAGTVSAASPLLASACASLPSSPLLPRLVAPFCARDGRGDALGLLCHQC